MKEDSRTAYLAESLKELNRALSHLQYSANSVVQAANIKDLDEESLSRIEAFTSRFARLVDLLTKRVLRSLDQFEMHEPGTLLDIANRAEKRGLIKSVDWLRELRETRNAISHDYAGDRFISILAYCNEELNELINTCQRVEAYGNKLLAQDC
jgi:uncharacterized protein YutE (UPF0331/DUF86 family)